MGIKRSEIGKGVSYDRILDAMGDSLCIVGDDYTILYQNAALLKRVGDHIGDKCYAVFHNLEKTCDNCLAVEVMKTGESRSAIKSASLDGVQTHINITAAPIFDDDGRVTAVVETVNDITELVRLRDAVASSEELFRQIADNLPGVVWMRDKDKKKLLYLSPNFERVWGRPREEVYGDWKSWVGFIHKDDRGSFLETLESEVFAKGEYDDVSYSMEYRIVRPSGEIRWIKNRGFSVKDHEGRVYRFAGIAEDITDIKAAEVRREDLFAMLRHDLRTPLTMMEANLEIVMDSLDKDKYSEPIAIINTVKNKVKTPNTMIDDLSMIARAQSPSVSMKPMPQSLPGLVREAVILSKDQVKSKGLGLEIDIEDDLLPITFDRVSIQRAVINLLHNAINYTPSGGTIRVSVSDNHACEGVPGECQVVSISDNGPGIPADARDRVFEKYFRLDRDASQGTGLGLAIVKAVAEAHGGKVELESEVGVGSTFSIMLPTEGSPLL